MRSYDWGTTLLAGLAWAVVSFLVLPMAVILPVSLTDQRYLSFPQERVSLEHYRHLLTDSEWLASMAQSFVVAVASTAIAVALGVLCSIGCWRLASGLAESVRAAMLAPLIVPSIVYALGIYRFWVKLDLLDSYLGIIVAHAVTGLPYVVITVSTSLAGFDLRLEQASRNLGASVSDTVRWVILPNILPGVASGAIFAFIHSWDELVIVLFIASRRLFTLPRRIWNGINENVDPTIAAVATMLIVFSLVLMLAEAAVRRRRG